MRRILLFVVIVAAVLSAGVASAAVGVSAKAGTLGLGGDLTVGLVDKLNVRVGVNYLQLNMEKGDLAGDIKEVSASLNLNTVAGLLDWHPAGNNFRISAGAMLNRNNFKITATPGDNVSINEQDFNVSSLDGEIAFRDFAPYVGIGFGNAGKKDKDTHWRFSFDLGVMFHGEPEVELSATATNPDNQHALDEAVAEESKTIINDVKPFTLYPVLSFGVSYVF